MDAKRGGDHVMADTPPLCVCVCVSTQRIKISGFLHNWVGNIFCCAFIRMAGIVQWVSRRCACINNFTFFVDASILCYQFIECMC